MSKLIRFVMTDLVRNRVIIAYTAILLIISLSVFNLEDNPSKGVLSMLNIMLHLTPLFSIVFSAIYLYNSAEFIELLVSQPIPRKTIWRSLFFGLAFSFGFAFLLAVGIPVLIYAPLATALTMTVSGLFLSIIFVALSFAVTVRIRDKARGIGLVVLAWLFFSIIFDGIVLFILFQFSDYPLQELMIALGMLNPVDLARILVLLQLDISALMGVTGAVFRDFFGSAPGMLCSIASLSVWVCLPLWLSGRWFRRKDL